MRARLVVFSPKWVHEQMAMQIWHSVQSWRFSFSIFDSLLEGYGCLFHFPINLSIKEMLGLIIALDKAINLYFNHAKYSG
jgi:hypothetical protein